MDQSQLVHDVPSLLTASSPLALPLLIEEHSGMARCAEPVTVGIPFPKGAVLEPERLMLVDQQGQRCPLQIQVLARWFDGSLQWALLDFQAHIEARKQALYRLEHACGTTPEQDGPQLTVQQSGTAICVNTGPAVFYLSTHTGKLVDRVVVQGNDLLEPDGSSLILADDTGRAYAPHVSAMSLETAGPLRVTLKMQGEFHDARAAATLHFVGRLSFYAGHSLVQLQLTLHNARTAHHSGGLWDLGDAGSVYFKDLSLHIPLRVQTGLRTLWRTRADQPGNEQEATHLSIYQDSSGGENWQSSNHVNRSGQVMHAFRGYRVTADGHILQEGNRATPTLALSDGRYSIAATLEQFWQNFPKALDVDHHQLIVRLFPQQYNDVYELQGGEQKTHTVYILFTDLAEQRTPLEWVHDRLIPHTTPQWYASSQALHYLTPYSHDYDDAYYPLVKTAIEGPQSFFARREVIDEYGWRHFGDLYADHEAVGHTAQAPLVSHYNNQYDVIYGTIIHSLRTADQRWFELARDLARHVIDIDIYHTREDRPSYNGGLFWHTDHYTDAATATHRAYSRQSVAPEAIQHYGGGPSNEQNYTTGLLHYYYLTGDSLAQDAVQSLADWVINMDAATRHGLGRFDNRPTGRCSTTASLEYHGPGRGAGNSINALLDAYLLTREERYISKAEQLIRRCIHPQDDIASRRLDDVEYRWSYTVFLQVLGKYLAVKAEQGAVDAMYSYAQASLLHYAAWMLTHEVPYTAVFDRVLLPTETWPAQDMRKSHVFYLAAKYAGEPQLRQSFRQKAAFFFTHSLQDLRTFSTCTLTRPIVLLLTNAYMHAYFQQHCDEAGPHSDTPYDFGQPARFTPQFHELYWVRKTLRTVLAVMSRLRSLYSALPTIQALVGGRRG